MTFVADSRPVAEEDIERSGLMIAPQEFLDKLSVEQKQEQSVSHVILQRDRSTGEPIQRPLRRSVKMLTIKFPQTLLGTLSLALNLRRIRAILSGV